MFLYLEHTKLKYEQNKAHASHKWHYYKRKRSFFSLQFYSGN